MADLTLQQLAWIVGVVLVFAACGWAWDVARQAGLSPWAAISRYIAVQIVKDYQDAAPADLYVMSRQDDRPAQTDQTDEQTDPVSEADRWMKRIEIDRTKTALIELLVYSGWDVSQVRSVLKGDNGTLGTEVDAARKRLGIEPELPRMIAVRDNGSSARFIPITTDSDYPYQAPA